MRQLYRGLEQRKGENCLRVGGTGRGVVKGIKKIYGGCCVMGGKWLLRSPKSDGTGKKAGGVKVCKGGI